MFMRIFLGFLALNSVLYGVGQETLISNSSVLMVRLEPSAKGSAGQMYVHVVVTNASMKPLTFGVLAPLIKYEVKDSKGHSIEEKLRVNESDGAGKIPAAGSWPSFTLLPGESSESDSDLSKLFALKPEEKYSVTVKSAKEGVSIEGSRSNTVVLTTRQ